MGTPRQPRRWLWPVVTVLALAVIGVVGAWTGWLSVGPPNDRDNTQPPASTTPTYPSDGYNVTAGQGGSAVAADGTTPIGYDGSCQGAIAAATNYNTFVVEAIATDRWTPESFQAVIDQIVGFDGNDPTGLRTQLLASREELRSLIFEATSGAASTLNIGATYPERGGYLVHACSAEGQAVIDIVSYWEEPPGGLVVTQELPDGRTEKIPAGGPMDHRVSVSWFNGDWRLIAWEELTDTPVPYDDLGTLSRLNPSSRYRQAWMNASGEPWAEYANAPR